MIPKHRPWLGAAALWNAFRPVWRSDTRADFERALAVRAGARYALAFSYAHAGFYALLQALEIRGAEIVLPAYTCSIMADVVVATGNTPVFVDITLDDDTLDLSQLPAALSPQTRAIVATPMFGHPCDVDAARAAAGESVLMIEDAALMFPTARSQGDVALYSFGPGKPLFTVRGGALVMDDPQLYARVYDYRARFMDALPPAQYFKRWLLLAYHVVRAQPLGLALLNRLGLSKGGGGAASGLPDDYALRMTDFQAQLGLAQVAHAATLLAQRRELALAYYTALSGRPGIVPPPVTTPAAHYGLYSVRVPHRDALRFCERLHAQGIEVGRTFNYAAPHLERFRRFARGPYPNAARLAQEVVNLPLYPGMSYATLHYITDTIQAILKSERSQL